MKHTSSNVENRTNDGAIAGVITKEFVFSHETRGRRYLKGIVSVKRLSDASDEINVVVPEAMLSQAKVSEGDCVYMPGSFRSIYVTDENGKSRLCLYFYPRIMYKRDEGHFRYRNVLSLEGHICREVNLRKASLSGRNISDIILAVHREKFNGKITTDYIPLIVWNLTIADIKELPVGERVRISGRIQSRNYIKDDRIHTVHEVSVNTLETVGENNAVKTDEE